MTTTPQLVSNSEELNALRDLADSLFTSIVTPHLHTPEVALPFARDSWRALEESGLTLLTTPEAYGGSGAGVTEAAILLEQSGYHAVPAPLAHTDVLGAWLLTTAGKSVPSAPITVVSVDAASHTTGEMTAEHVPWGAISEYIVVVGRDFVGLLPSREATEVTPVGDLAGEAHASVRFSLDDLDRNTVPVDLRDELVVRGAWARSSQICGATARAVDLAIEHANTRQQFGRPIVKFQAVQDLITRSVGALTTAKAAASHATQVIAEDGFGTERATIATAAAKLQAGRAAVGVSRNVHQVFGALGFTIDHHLRHYTTRSLAWTREFGTPTEWSIRIGRAVSQSDGTAWTFTVSH